MSKDTFDDFWYSYYSILFGQHQAISDSHDDGEHNVSKKD